MNTNIEQAIKLFPPSIFSCPFLTSISLKGPQLLLYRKKKKKRDPLSINSVKLPLFSLQTKVGMPAHTALNYAQQGSCI